MNDVESFYEGAWGIVNCLDYTTKGGYVDVLAEAIFDTAPEGATLEGLLDYFATADEGGVLEEWVRYDAEDVGDAESGPRLREWTTLRFIDLQAVDPGYPPLNYDELVKGFEYNPAVRSE